MNPEIEMYDTTLRDGSQGEGINFSVADKLRIAERLDAFGIHYIEGGWPGSNPKDIEFFQQVKRKQFKNSKMVAFGSTRRKNLPVQVDDQVLLLLAADTPVITIYGKTWMLHVREVLNTTPEENLEMIRDTVRYLKENSRRVIYDAEHAFDGYKDNPEYAMATWRAAEEAGAELIVLCDTNGGCLPSEITKIVQAARAGLKARIGIHTHNDTELGVANALVAIEAGATHVQGTINGYGERTGNCNLTSVIPNVALKMGLRCLPEQSLLKLKELSQFVDEIANIRHDPRQPWVGAAAFAHKGGTHVNAVQKVIHSYEHVNPESIGNTRRILISDLAGRSNIVLKAQELGFNITNDTPELKAILTRIKELEHQGYEFEAAEGSLALLIRKTLKHEHAPFKVDAYHVSMRRDGSVSTCEATVKVRVGEKRAHTVADGDGPVNALDSALRAALIKFFPSLAKVQLTDYKVRILDSAVGTAAKTRVLLQCSDGKEEWSTVGVSENIVEASLQALVDSVQFALFKEV
jgi:2-isopropylmalate synthase